MKKKNQLLSVLAVGLLASPMAAQAQADYNFQLIDHPGTPRTQVFGINDLGNVVGNGDDFTVASFAFVYASRTGTFTDVAPAAGFASTSVLGITDSGVMVGSVLSMDLSTTSGMIRGKDGTFTVFSHPEAPSFTQARAVNNQGLVSGFRDISPGFRAGFIYDPMTETFTDVVPGRFTIEHGINSKGEVVGNTIFFSGEDPCGSPFTVNNGWLRAVDGSITYFQVNGESTRARGINDAGSIVGFVNDSASGKTKGFVVKLDGSPCESLTVADSDLLEISGFDFLFPEGITNSGVIVGIVRNDVADMHGFIATPR